MIINDDPGTPVATGGRRSQDANDQGHANGDSEIKRMYMIPEARGRGLSRLVLAGLEDDARVAGRTRMVLETGTKLPEACRADTAAGLGHDPPSPAVRRCGGDTRTVGQPYSL